MDRHFFEYLKLKIEKLKKLLALDGETQIGKLNKHYGGFLQEAFTIADKFGVSCKFFLTSRAY